MAAIDAGAVAGLPETDAYALQQYERIIRFRDEILAGKHATIKLPDSLREAVSSPSINPRNETSAANSSFQNNQAFTSNVQYAVGNSSTSPNAVPPTEPRAIVLTRSEELLVAELRAQRSRIEQGLQEDFLQSRHKKTNPNGGPVSQDGLDPSAILAAALVLVPELTFPAQADERPATGNGTENDSFDDNTFYSSQHDTPEFEPAPPAPVASAVPAASETDKQPAVANAVAAAAVPTNNKDERRSVNQPRQLRTYEELTESPATIQPPSAVPGLNNYIDSAGASTRKTKNARRAASGPVSKSVAATQPSVAAPTQPSSYIDLHPPSPLLRGHVQAPAAQQTQPLQLNEIPGLYGNASSSKSNVGAPAQVAALRSEPSSRTSPDSSSQGGQSKRKNKRKKRKSERQTLENQSALENRTRHIKAEPRSPSPIAGPSYLRPNKRQRQQNHQTQNSAYDDVVYDPAMPSAPADGNGNSQQPSYYQERPPAGYEGSGMYSATGASMPTSNARVSRDYVTERVIADDGYSRDYIPQPALRAEYAARGSQMARPVQQIVSHPDSYQEGALSYRNSPQATRYSIHPDGDSFHEPARPQPARILVDAYGREYLEPARQLIRHSVAPTPLPGEPNRLYERAPPQPVSRYQGAGSLEGRGYLFAQPASPYDAPRRIISQPEYVSYDNRDVRYREYSARPIANPGELVPVRPQEHRVFADSGREYAGRASSMRPMEQTRVPGGIGSYGHSPGVRPEASGVMYGLERGMAPPGINAYEPWSANQGLVEKEVGERMYAAATPNEALSSRVATGQEALYSRGNGPDGFR